MSLKSLSRLRVADGIDAAQAPLGFSVWITPTRGATPAELHKLEDRIDAYCVEHGLERSGTHRQMLVWSEDRSLTLADQVDLLLWLIGEYGTHEVAVGALQSHSGRPSEHGRLPALQARFGDLDLIAITWLFRAGRLGAAQAAEMLGGFRVPATLH